MTDNSGETVLFNTGAKVVARDDIGLFRPGVRRGTTGTVVGRTPAGELEVSFDNGRVELVRARSLTTMVDEV